MQLPDSIKDLKLNSIRILLVRNNRLCAFPASWPSGVLVSAAILCAHNEQSNISGSFGFVGQQFSGH